MEEIIDNLKSENIKVRLELQRMKDEVVSL